MPVLRPPRIYHDKERKQFYIRRKKKKIYFPVGTSKKQAQKLAIKHLQMEPRGRAHNVSINAQPLQPLYGYTRRKYKDSPLVVSYGSLQKKEQDDVARFIKQREKVLSMKDTDEKIAELKKQALAEKNAIIIKAKRKIESEQQARADEVGTILTRVEESSNPKKFASDTKMRNLIRYQGLLIDREAKKPKEEKLPEEDRADAEAEALALAEEEKQGIPEEERERLARRRAEVRYQTAERIREQRAQVPRQQSAVKPEPEETLDDIPALEPILEEASASASAESVPVPSLSFTDSLKARIFGKGMKYTMPDEPENFKEQLKRDGLYSDQIAEMMKPYKKSGFLGVIASDEIQHLIEPSMQFDRFGWVMNTDPSDKPGEHWVAVFVDLRNEREIDYYDSFAEDPPANFSTQIKELIDSHDPPYYLKYKINRIKQQAENSTLCGFHAMRFLIDRFHGKPFKECTGYSEVKKSEKQAGQMANKYNKFGYI